ncbi:MAG: glycosyltransferase [Myxococcota bacterium]
MIHVVGIGIAIFWLGVVAKVGKAKAEKKWVVGPEVATEGTLPHLTVVIPARDEARNIRACLDAVLASDHPDFDVVVFDDGSTDGTAELCAGARVIRGEGAVPEGWKGKPWALHRATRGLDAPWLLFLDADVRVHPACLRIAHARAIADEADFLSGFGKLVMGSFWEKVIQPSVGGLILAGNDLDAVNDPERKDRIIANGQLILVRRDAYEAVGGHEAVKDDILDDVGLAKAFVDKGLKLRVFMMRELFSCRMYTSLAELWYGWTKNLYAGMGHRLDRVVFLVGFIAFEFLLPYAMVVAGAATARADVLAWGTGLVALIHAVRAWMDGIFGQERAYGLLQPLGAVALVGLLVDSARRSRAGTVRWKGRTYAA